MWYSSAYAEQTLILYNEDQGRSVECFIKATKNGDWIDITCEPNEKRRAKLMDDTPFDLAVRYRRDRLTIVEYRIENQVPSRFDTGTKDFAKSFIVAPSTAVVWEKNDRGEWISRLPVDDEKDASCHWLMAAWNDKICLQLPQNCSPELVHDPVKPTLPRPKPKRGGSEIGAIIK